MIPGDLPVEDFREAANLGVPALGVVGAGNVREAFDGDLRQLSDLLQGAIRKALELSGEEDWWPFIHAIFQDWFVVETKDGRLLRYGYEVDGTKVSLGTPIEVRKTFEPVESGRPARLSEASAFVEGETGRAGAWRIRVIKAGTSVNRNHYSDAVLREAVQLFEGVRVFAKSDEEHLAGGGRDFRNLIGRLIDPVFVEGASVDAGEIHATLQLIEPDGPVGVKLREAWSRGLASLFGFSIDARATARTRRQNGQEIREAAKFLTVNSVDLIVQPGAGGGIVDLMEAQKETLMTREQIIALLEAAGVLTAGDADALTDDDLQTRLAEALPSPASSPASSRTDTGAGSSSDADHVREAVALVEARADMRERVARSSLPEQAKARVRGRFAEAQSFTEADVDTAIRDEAEYLATVAESGRVRGLGAAARVEMGESRFEKTSQMLDAFFDRGHKDHRHAGSFKECYVAMTGDTRVTGLMRNCDEALMREALDSSSFTDVLGDAVTRRMLADYRTQGQYDVWRPIANVTRINDFRTQERTRVGGYGDIPAVLEGADYTALTSPTDEMATYAVAKKGGLETVTLEMIKNDDVGVIRRIPIDLSRAAKRTLAKFVLDFIRTNPEIYDEENLFSVAHGNLGSAALSGTSLAAGRLAMLKQQELSSNEQLGIGPKYLWVPADLQETGANLFRRTTENDKTFLQSLSLEVMPVWYWTDVSDWALSADPDDIPSIEVGFLDGEEEPELFTQDSPTHGSMFASDQITYKIRHIYGGAVCDYRGLYKSVVAD